MTADDIRFIVRLIRGDQARIARDLAARPGVLDRLAEAAETEGLAVVLLRALPSLPSSARVSAPRLDALESRRLIQDARAAAILDALGHLASTFAGAGQPFLLLKGPYLAARYYGDSRGREFVDLDLLVPSKDRARACRLLESDGYARRSRVIGGEALTGFFVHGFDFARGRASIDLHWHLIRHPSVRVDERLLWSAHDTYTLDGRPFGVLSAGHEVVFHALSLLRDIERGRPKTKNVVDIIQVAAACDADLDWDALFERGREDGTLGPLVNVLSMCLDIADAHDLAPRLAHALERRASRLVSARPSVQPGHFAPEWMHLGNRWWAARAYDTPPAVWLMWWAASLPFRVAVHRHHGAARTNQPHRNPPR
jgi:hypothetical protein